jgi:hypothetical protein|tara:strand:- start:155 stop:751 length:597 start_codon:yes stop_codon:yes gene_type:complete
MCGVEMFLAIVLHGGPWVLVVMGAAVALKPPPPTDRFAIRLWIAAFAVVALVISAAGGGGWYLDRQERIRADAEFKKFKDELTGGDNFAFVRARQETSEDGKNWIAIETTGALPSLLVGFHPLSLDGTPVGEKKWVHFSDLPETTFNTSVVLAPGRYRIDFKMGDKIWTEHLDFERSEEGIDQVLWVERNGKVIHREP